MKTTRSLIFAAVLLVALAALHADDLGGVVFGFEGHQGPAVVAAELIGHFKLQLRVDPKAETKPLVICVELPNSGANAWPAADVEVRDANGKALLVRRTGIEWFKLLVPLPASVTTCIVQAVEPPGGWPKPTTDKDRAIQDSISGVKMRIAKWHGGRAAALSLRFDDSHPTHLTRVVPILREYGFRGTFMINPCRRACKSGQVLASKSGQRFRRREDERAGSVWWRGLGGDGGWRCLSLDGGSGRGACRAARGL